MTTAVLLRSGMMGNYHVPFCRAVEGVTLSLTLIPNCGLLTGKKSLSQRVHNCQHGRKRAVARRMFHSRVDNYELFG